MHTTKFFLLWLLLLFSQSAWAQQSQSLYFELGGSGGLASVNYEKGIVQKEKIWLSGSAGFSLAPIDKNNGLGLVFPLLLHGYLGTSATRLELGIGQGLTFTTKGSFFILGTACLGLRYQSPEKKHFFRFSYTPLISYLVDFQLQHWAGFSIGFQLNSKK